MMDPRVQKLAKNLVGFSTRVQPGDNVLIEARDGGEDLVKALVREVSAAGGRPFGWLRRKESERELALGCTREQLELRAEADALLMSKMQVYIGFTAIQNDSELSDVPAERMELVSCVYEQPVHGEIRVPKTRWCVLRYPTPAMA